MGWMCETNPSHEGYLVAVERLDGVWREVNYPDDRARENVQAVMVGCDCGWRSPRIAAPLRTLYRPFAVTTDERFEEHCRLLWHEHLDAEERRTHGSVVDGHRVVSRWYHDVLWLEWRS